MAEQRKYFGTDGVRGRVGESLIHPEFVMKLGWAAGRVLTGGKRGKVLIGKDTRISGYMFESALEAGLSAAGVDIEFLGPMPTPAISYLTRTLRANAGIVISASHNNYEDNGIKFFFHDGTKLPDELELKIEKQLEEPLTVVESRHLGKAKRVGDAAGRYIEFCKSTIPSFTNLSGLKIVLDCANGATYHVAPKVFAEIGANIIEIASHPDGFNINDRCGSTYPENLRKVVMAEKADLGIALDGDGDRLIMVDHLGEVVDGDELLWVIAKDAMSHERLKGGVVGTVMSNLGLELALKGLGIPFSRSKVGDRYVIEEMKRKGWQLGGETSGHLIMLNATTTGDGIVSALQVLSAMYNTSLSLHDLKAGMHKCPQVMINVSARQPQELAMLPEVVLATKMAEEQLKGSGRVLLRPSGTEPLVRVMVEGQDEAFVARVANDLADKVRGIGSGGIGVV